MAPSDGHTALAEAAPQQDGPASAAAAVSPPPALSAAQDPPLPCLLGQDLGNGASKLYGPRGCVEVVSHVSVDGGESYAALEGMSRARPPLRIALPDGSTFYVGAGASFWSSRSLSNYAYDRLTGTPEVRALFYAGLTAYMREFGLAGPVRLTVGLPFALAATTAEAERARRQVKSWLEGLHTWNADDAAYSVHVESAAATPQAIGAVFDFLLDEAGAMRPERRACLAPERRGGPARELGVITVGMGTLEAAAVVIGRGDGGRSALQLVPRFTVGADVGVRRLFEIVDPRRQYKPGELDTLLRSRQLDVSAAVRIWEREVIAALEPRWGEDWRRFGQVVLVGGGALPFLLGSRLRERFGHLAWVPDNPVTSVAGGLYKCGLYQHAQGRR